MNGSISDMSFRLRQKDSSQYNRADLVTSFALKRGVYYFNNNDIKY